MDQKTLYYKIEGCVKNNNWLTESYEIWGGIRQGCLLSCLIFVIAVEYRGTSIRKNSNITGVTFGKYNIKLAQLVMTKYNEIQVAVKVVKEFGIHCGLKLNKNKTEGLLLGINKNKPQELTGAQVLLNLEVYTLILTQK